MNNEYMTHGQHNSNEITSGTWKNSKIQKQISLNKTNFLRGHWAFKLRGFDKVRQQGELKKRRSYNFQV